MTAHASESIRSLAVQRVLCGATVRSVGSDFGYSGSQISKWCKRAGIDMTLRNKKSGKGTVVNDSYFKIVDSSEKAYLLGWMATDGCVFSPRGKMKSSLVVLKCKDKWVLDLFAREIGWRSPTLSSSNGRPYWRVAVPSDVMAGDLASHGIVPMKTYDLFVRVPKEYSFDFWRGAVDGDGCLSTDKGYPVLSICGCESFVRQFESFSLSIGLKGSFGEYRRYSKVEGWTLKRYTLRGRAAVKMAGALYSSELSLPRKLSIARSWICQEVKRAQAT